MSFSSCLCYYRVIFYLYKQFFFSLMRSCSQDRLVGLLLTWEKHWFNPAPSLCLSHTLQMFFFILNMKPESLTYFPTHRCEKITNDCDWSKRNWGYRNTRECMMKEPLPSPSPNHVFIWSRNWLACKQQDNQTQSRQRPRGDNMSPLLNMYDTPINIGDGKNQNCTNCTAGSDTLCFPPGNMQVLLKLLWMKWWSLAVCDDFVMKPFRITTACCSAVCPEPAMTDSTFF